MKDVMTSLKVLAGVFLLQLLFLHSPAHSDTTTDILDQMTGPAGSYTPCSGSACWGGYSGGQTPSWNGYIARWGYGGGWLNWTIAMNQVLKENGIQVEGYHYKWVVKNYNAGYGTSQPGSTPDHLLIDLIVYDNSGNQVYFKRFDYSRYISNWTEFTGTEYFATPFDPASIGNINLRALGDDHGNWAGWYGPEFNFSASSINFIYSADPCYNNPLYGPECSGYAEAYAQYLYDQQCAANPLYDSGCPGYQTAYYNMQCTINPLYDSGCPGYAQAYYDQQCSLDPLYDTGCNGYAQAYYDQQCSIDTLYDSGCPGYAAAYFAYQCELNPLYDRQCPGYDVAYAKENILNVESPTSTPESVATAPTATVPVTDPTAIAKPSATGDSTVDSILAETNDVPIITVPVMDEAPVETTSSVAETEEGQEEEQVEAELVAALEETSDDQTETSAGDESGSDEESDGGDSESSNESEGEASDGGDSKSESKDSKREKMKKLVAERAANLANMMAAAATAEAQVALQAQILALISYVPDFDDYQTMMNGGYMPDAQGYPDTQVPESRRGLRNGLAQQLLHEKMVEQQYNRE